MEIFLTTYTIQSIVSVSSVLYYQFLFRFSSSSRHKGSSQNEENSGGLVSSHWTESIWIAQAVSLVILVEAFGGAISFPRTRYRINTTGFILKTLQIITLLINGPLFHSLIFLIPWTPWITTVSMPWFLGYVGLQPLRAGGILLGVHSRAWPSRGSP